MKKRVLKIAALLMAAVGFAPQAQADTDLLTQEKGYTKITQMPADENLDDYYFIIVDKEQDLMMTLGAGSQQGNQYKTWWYRTSVDPATDLNRVWTIEANHGQNNNPVGYAFRSVSEPTYLMQTEWDAAWNFRTHDQPNPCDWTQFLFTYSQEGDYWTFENGKYPEGSSFWSPGYIGAWEEAGIMNNAEVAANKLGDKIGHFVIYSILKTTFDNFFLSDDQEEAQAYITSYYEAVSTNSTADEEVKAAYTQAIATAKSAVESATVIADIDAAMAALETARQTYVLAATPNSGFSFDYSFLIAGACDSNNGWTKTYGPVVSGAQDNYGIQTSTNKNNGELTSETYLETWTPATVGDNQQPNMYGAGQLYYTATNLPAGHYKISAYTFDGNKSGVVDFFVNDQKKTLDATTDLFTLSSISDVAIAPYAETLIGLEIKEAGKTQWVGITNIKLEYLSPLTDEETLPLAKESLTTLAEETAQKDIKTNVGTAAFQIPQALADAVTAAINNGTTVAEKADATLEEVNAAIEALNSAVAAFNAPALNAPAAGDRFNVIINADGGSIDNMAWTCIYNEAASADGWYNLQWAHAADANYAQALIFTPTGEKNQYTISFIDAEGNTRYICTQKAAGYLDNGGPSGRADRIRVTTDASKALKVNISTTATEGIWNLNNTEHGQNIGATNGGDAGVFTSNSVCGLTLVKAEEAEVSLTVTEAGWATLILPFNAEVPDGLAAYTCGEAEETATEGEATLVLEEAATLAANTPYIIQGAADTYYSFSGYGLATQDTYGNSFMTGTLVEKAAADQGTYVLQNQDGKVGFYLVGDAQPKVGAYRAYLNAEAAPAGSNVQAFILKGIDGDGTTTGIDGTVAEADATVNVYNLNGILVRQNVKMSEALDGLQKGIYIVNGTKKAVK